jgi:APA family basic amino acid/polyamine antiporter
MVVAACYAHGQAVAFYLIIFVVIMIIGILINSNKGFVNTQKDSLRG